MTRERVLTVTRKDCDRETFKVGGHGGQKVNKTNSGVRFRHHASGAVGEARDTRSQEQNERLAWRRMAESPVFLAWVSDQHNQIEKKVEEAMSPHNLLIEAWNGEEWVMTS